MTCKDIFSDYYEKLLRLPMQDSIFVAKLTRQKLLPGDSKRSIEGQLTPTEKASYFLDNVIKPSIEIGSADSFDALLSVMEQCEYDHIEKLAVEIKSKIYGNHITIL